MDYEGARLNIENLTSENLMPPEFLDWVRVESISSLSGTLADGVDNIGSAGVAVTKVKNEMFDDFDEDLDHVLLIERLRMLLSRFHIFLVIIFSVSVVICFYRLGLYAYTPFPILRKGLHLVLLWLKCCFSLSIIVPNF